MTDLERMARAAYEKMTAIVADKVSGQPFRAWEDLPPLQRSIAMDSQRAALSALREPSKGAIQAAYDAYYNGGRSSGTDDIWRAMIDFILNDNNGRD